MEGHHADKDDDTQGLSIIVWLVKAAPVVRTFKVGHVPFCMDDGTTNHTVVSRRWLLGAAAGSTARAYAATAAGALAYGRATQIAGSAALTAAASVPAPLPSLFQINPVGMNLGFEGLADYGAAFPFLDRSKTCASWQVKGGSQDGKVLEEINGLNANLYPIILPGDATHIENKFNVEGALGPADKQIYVWESNKTDTQFEPVGQILSNRVTHGRRRIEFKPQAFPAGGGFIVYIKINALPTPFAEGDSYRLFRKDQQGLLDAGEIFGPDYLALTTFSILRFMDWDSTNHDIRRTWAGRPRTSWAAWNPQTGVPLEIQVAFCNKLRRNGWFHLHASTEDDYAVKFGQLLKQKLAPDLLAILEYGNENWNFGFQSYHHIYVMPGGPSPPTDDPSWGKSGYRAARLMALACQATGYDPRFRPVMATKTGFQEVATGMFRGADAAIAEWSNPSHGQYNAEFAQRFKGIAQLFPYFAGTTYVGGGLAPVAPTDKALVEIMADRNAAGDPTGLADAFAHLRFGNKLSTGTYDTLVAMASNLTATFAGAVARGMVPVAYEGGFHLNADKVWPDGDPKQAVVVKLFSDISYDERAYTFYMDMHRIARSVGVMIDCHLSDVSARYSKYGIWGVKPHVYAPDTPRLRALRDFDNNPGTMPVPGHIRGDRAL